MRILKSFIIAFSMYSQIPMPQFEWKEEDMKYMLCFFPLVGAVIGLCLYGWEKLCTGMEINGLCRTLVGTAIPLLLTGGIHVDGYMDTMDAFHSFQSRERKIEILKDPHIGAFSVIMLAAYGLLYAGGYAQLESLIGIKIIGMGFALSRCLSAVGVLSFPCAKKEGLLHLFASNAAKKTVKGILYLEIFLCVAGMIWQDHIAGSIVVLAAFAAFFYYGLRCKKELGGVTGDTAGFFVLICEVSMIFAAVFTIR